MACGARKAAGRTNGEKFFGSLFFKKGTACFLNGPSARRCSGKKIQYESNNSLFIYVFSTPGNGEAKHVFVLLCPFPRKERSKTNKSFCFFFQKEALAFFPRES
jgi:hypothetical protein